MGCPCNDNRPKQFVYVDEKGQETVKSTEVEARAMQIRNGNKGTVRPVFA
jgi:hypothetical protein